MAEHNAARKHWRADGLPKHGLTRRQAKRAETERKGLTAYKCPICRSWHLGYRSPERKEALR